jgi:predicted HTH domain antitoxin
MPIMTLTVTIPDFIAASLRLLDAGCERRVLEAVALEGYRSGDLSRGEVGDMLGLDYWETEAFLKRRGADYGLNEDDLAEDRRKLDQLLAAS